MSTLRIPEILAPAGNMESLLAAIDSGADAVYFGGKYLNARRNAANFAEDQAVCDAVDLCHLYGVKAYLTLNTLLFDSENQQAIDGIVLACKAGFDAIIAQDWGIISLVRQICPDMPIHASTQMSVHNLADADALWEQGVRRVVLARELSRRELARIIKHSPIETEVFVHGALCYSVSGQCYFSAFLGERSGNRGLCAQVCRLPFGVKDPNNYSLSLKDLTLIDYVDELAQLGVVSLKIEGRMKSPQYVAASVSQFKNALQHKKYDKTQLEEMFSRSGFTQGYYLSAIDETMFGTRTKQDLRKTTSAQNNCEISAATKQIPVDIAFSVSLDAVTITLTDEDGRVASHRLNGAQPAQTLPLTDAQIKTQLSTLGNTPFVARNIEGTLQKNCFLPVSALNELRRGAVTRLIQLRQKRHTYTMHPLSKKQKLPYRPTQPPQYTASFYQLSQLNDEILQKLRYASVDIFELQKAPDAFLQQYQDKLVAELPRIYFQDENLLTEALTQLHDHGIHLAKCHSVGRASLAQKAGYRILFGFGVNATNSETLAFLSSYSPLYTTLSVELSAKHIRNLHASSATAIIAYGYFPLMASRACPLQREISCTQCRNQKGTALIDRKGRQFPVLCRKDHIEILNSVPIYLADKQDAFAVSFFEFLFTQETPQQIMQILTQYHHHLPCATSFTRGTYFRTIE